MEIIEDWDVCPKLPAFSPAKSSPSIHLVQLALDGYSQLAADTILNREHLGNLSRIVGDSIRLLNLSFIEDKEGDRGDRETAVRVLLELGLNLVGMERKRVGFSEEEVGRAISEITEILRRWKDYEKRERGDRTTAQRVIDQILKEMKTVLKGKSMVAHMAAEIGNRLEESDPSGSFISGSKDAIQSNAYYEIVDRGLSKFGNDSATGLRWARHLGAVQVSSNPVIAARAFEEVPELWRRFDRTALKNHPEWRIDAGRFQDEIALFGTVTSLLPNVLDFRPVALLSNFEDGMVSIQLNPNIASSIEESVKDALKIYTILEEILSVYDAQLMPGVSLKGFGRPNVVFKVATADPAAIALTERLNSIGLGTNNTVTFTVSQEVKIVLSALKGLAAAQRAGIPITRVYITNMEGRMEDHLREYLAQEFLRSSFEGENTSKKRSRIESIGAKIGAANDLKSRNESLAQEIELITSKRYLRSLNDEWFVEAIGRDRALHASQLESDIHMSGIYVTRKVYRLVFNPKVRSNWIRFIEAEFGLSRDMAASVFDSVDLLPSSKRRDDDTYFVLGNREIRNLTNTEFPDHQLKVLQRSREKDFDMLEYENSISNEPDPQVLGRLLKIPDFKKGYELTPELAKRLEQIGIDVRNDELGGLREEEWRSYGPARKTMDEFGSAFLGFKNELVRFVDSSQKKQVIGTR